MIFGKKDTSPKPSVILSLRKHVAQYFNYFIKAMDVDYKSSEDAFEMVKRRHEYNKINKVMLLAHRDIVKDMNKATDDMLSIWPEGKSTIGYLLKAADNVDKIIEQQIQFIDFDESGASPEQLATLSRSITLNNRLLTLNYQENLEKGRRMLKELTEIDINSLDDNEV
jgi:hypothetical protein